MDIRKMAENFLDEYETLCIKHGVVMLGDATENNFAKGLKFSSVSDGGKIRIETEEVKVNDFCGALRTAFR